MGGGRRCFQAPATTASASLLWVKTALSTGTTRGSCAKAASECYRDQMDQYPHSLVRLVRDHVEHQRASKIAEKSKWAYVHPIKKDKLLAKTRDDTPWAPRRNVGHV